MRPDVSGGGSDFIALTKPRVTAITVQETSMAKATFRSDKTALRDEVVRRVRQFDRARDRPREWGLQRLTAIAVIPLSLYFAASVLSLETSDRKTAADWLSLPVLAFVVVFVVLAGITHALIGVHSVFLDYVHTRTHSWWPFD
jgi:succinate dehydrogenase / fumarate reductase membrane anchor subunit